MHKFRLWLLGRFFPAVAKEEIALMQREIVRQQVEIDRLNAYIDGLENGIRFQRRIVINNEVKQ